MTTKTGIAEPQATARLFHALSDPTRLQIIGMLQDGERCVCDLIDTIGAAQSRLSFHLRVLKDADVLDDRRDGRWVYYSINPKTLDRIAVAVHALAPQEHRSTPRACCG